MEARIQDEGVVICEDLDGVRVYLAGCFDIETAPILRAHLLACVDEHKEISVDLCFVKWIGGATLACLVEALAAAKGRKKRLSLRGGKALSEALRGARLEGLFDLV